MTKPDEQSWRDMLANLNPYREPNTEDKGQWRPELEKKIAEYEKLKEEEAMAEELSFNWLFEADAQYIHKPQARANFNETETTIYDGVPAGPIEHDPQKAQIYIANINPAVASGQVEELIRAEREGGSVNIQKYVHEEDAEWIDGKPANNIIYQQLFRTNETDTGDMTLTDYLRQNTKRDKQHWYAQHTSMLLRALFDADEKSDTTMPVSEAKQILSHYPIQFIDLVPYRTQNADDFIKFIQIKSTSSYQAKSVEAYQLATNKQKSFKALPSGAQVALLPSTQFILASVIERIRQYLDEPNRIPAPTFVLRSYKNWWQPALQVFLTQRWDILPASLKEKGPTVASLLQAFEQDFFWQYVSAQSASISDRNLEKIQGTGDFKDTFVTPFRHATITRE